MEPRVWEFDLGREKDVPPHPPSPQCPPLPFPWGVLYSGPNPDGTRKMCLNCMMYAANDRTCNIHAPNVEVAPMAICGYHVYGYPMEERMEHPGIVYVDPALSGLEVIPGGTSCDICIYYAPTSREKGLCHAVAKEKDGLPPQPVEALGCCSRWEPRA